MEHTYLIHQANALEDSIERMKVKKIPAKPLHAKKTMKYGQLVCQISITFGQFSHFLILNFSSIWLNHFFIKYFVKL